MQDVHAMLQALARVPDGPPVVSLFLDTAWRDEQQRERVRLFFREQCRDARARFDKDDARRTSLERTLEVLSGQVERIVNRDLHEDAGGIVMFCSAERDLYEEVALAQPIAQAMFVDDRPRLGPLIEFMSTLTPALLVDVDHSGARILELAYGDVVDRRGVQRDVPQKHKAGGWSQRNIQQWVDQRIHAVWRECAALLERLSGELGNPPIVLFGVNENIQGFRKQLSAAVADRIIASLPPGTDERSMVLAARAALEEERIAMDFAQMHRVLQQGLSDRVGTIGLEETVMAMNERRVRVLALSRSFDGTGFACGNCDAIWMVGATGCVFCGGQTRMNGLREELVRRALRDGAEVLVVPPGNRLDSYHGIGSLLRHLSGDEFEAIPYGAPTTPTLAL